MQDCSAGWLRRRVAHPVRRVTGGLVATFAAALAVLAPSGAVSAHATIESISPADGTLLATAPAEIRITFSEPISERFVEVEVVTATTPVTGPVDAARALDDDSTLVISLPPLADGSYQIGFSVRDEIDLHEVRGRTSFAVGDHAVVAASAPFVPGPQPWETSARWMFATGLALGVGVLVLRTRWAVLPTPAPRRLAVVAGVAMLAVVAGRLGVIAARAADLGTGWRDALTSVARTDDVTRLPVVLVAVGCLLPTALPHRWAWLDGPVRRGGSLSSRLSLGWAGVIWLALLASWGDHAALSGTIEPGVALAKAAHLLGLGLWIGVLMVTAIVYARTGRTAAALRASSSVAVAGAVTALASGLALASRTVISITGAAATTFGQFLLLKLALVVVAVVAGIAHRRHPRPWRVLGEGAVLSAVVIAGAAMATAGPATDRAYLAAPASTPPAMSTEQVGEVIVRARAVPGRPGPNDIEILVAQNRRPAPEVTGVLLSASTPAGDQVWEVQTDADGAAVVSGVDLPEGPNELRVTVSRSGRPDETGVARVTTTPLAYHHPVIVSSAPIRDLLRAAALAIALVGLAAFVVLRRRSTLQPAHVAAREPAVR